MNKTQKLANALQNGERLTAVQAMARYGFESTNSVRKAISNLRYSGHSIFSNTVNTRRGPVTKYVVGKAPRAVIAAGYRALAA